MRGTVVVASLLFLLGLLAWRLELDARDRNLPPKVDIVPSKRPEVEKIPETIRDVTPEKVLPPPDTRGAVLERLPDVEPPPPPPIPPKPVEHIRPSVVAAGLLRTKQGLIRLTGIDPLELEETCHDKSGHEWPCGMFARTNMRRFVRGRPILCEPVENDADTEQREVATRCHLDAYDMSAWLVWQGWARPHDGHFEEELAEARARKRGLWRDRAPGR